MMGNQMKKIIELQKYSDIDGYGNAIILFWGFITIEIVFLTVRGYHLSFGIKILEAGISLTIHS